MQENLPGAATVFPAAPGPLHRATPTRVHHPPARDRTIPLPLPRRGSAAVRTTHAPQAPPQCAQRVEQSPCANLVDWQSGRLAHPNPL